MRNYLRIYSDARPNSLQLVCITYILNDEFCIRRTVPYDTHAYFRSQNSDLRTLAAFYSTCTVEPTLKREKRENHNAQQCEHTRGHSTISDCE